MDRIRIGVIGAGAIAQIEHIPNLLRLSDRFTVAGVSDPSRTSRQFVSEQLGLPVFSESEELLAMPLEAVLIASPDPLHFEHVMAALDRKLHVFCEKPLCYSPGEIDIVIAARDAARCCLQVGYMKRFDPGYVTALDEMPGKADRLRYVSVEVNDPDAWPFVRHHPHRRGQDIASELVEETLEKQRAQVARAVNASLDARAYRGFVNAYCSSLVHDVNAVHGILDALAVPAGQVVGAQLFANGDGGQGTVRLLGGQAVWNMVHLTVPSLADYRERISLYFDDAMVELEFPSPWLNHQPTRLTVRKSDGHVLRSTDVRAGFEEAYVEQLKGFWSAVSEGRPVRNPAEHARRDQDLLCRLAEWHAGHPPGD